jgi:threonine/homoserine/homoserine lactone efflux protein
MPSVGQVVAFALTALVLIAIPGPSVLFVISRSLTLGRKAGLASVAGNAAGVYVQMLAIAIGLGTVVEQSLTVFTVIKLAGAAYLIYLGVQAIRHRRSLTAAFASRAEVKSTGRIVLDAFVVGIANPKAVIFFAAILPQFVNRSAGHVPVQMLFLGAVFFVVALISDGTWALAAGTARAWLTRKPARLEAIGGAGGLAMIGIGLKLAISGRHD